ncbi:molecular chaperone Hsp33 [Entomoplasma freundtii]|uniref:Heat shock protein 33 n=1 Tax=Entomoplasma freundtii TaxID=74700 RepID=A0A2K8NS87_9MOLU|nr:Hsp33 family molecular chaperone HslO [Entomoplasma freundtii]ATZ16715.1 heat shock protein 33 [Entomoplasma freundtii]TDY58118.1 molecular chaperone Hsp33 [Entomoplasma freundtii]
MDHGIRAISEKHHFKIFILDLTKTMQEIITLQGTNPFATILLSKATLATSLLALSLKNGEVLTASIDSKDAKTGKMITEFHDNHVRAYIQNPKFDITDEESKRFTNPYEWAWGTKGTLTINRQLRGYDPYVSKIALSSHGLDYDFMEFGRQSNQIQNLLMTMVALDKNWSVKKAVGLYIELLPNHTDDDIVYLEDKLQSTSIREQLLNEKDYETFLRILVPDAIKVGDNKISFRCTCNDEKIVDAIQLLGKQEITDMVKANEPAEVTCDFCKKKYLIAVSALQELIS